MKFTASNNWTAYATGTSKTLQWKVYIKNTTVLTDALTVGTWTDVTSYIRIDDLPDITTRIEYEVGQFVVDNITLTGSNVQWWKANVLTSAWLASTTQYLEVKIELQLGSGGALASDIAYMFHGYVDKANIEYAEIEDKVTFTVYSAEDVGSRLAGENLTVQYLNPDIDGAGTDGLALQAIAGVYVKDANVASFVLQNGVHAIEFQMSGSIRQLRLDDGAWANITASNTTYTLINGDVTQKLLVYVFDISKMPGNGTATDYVIVTSAGTTLPKQWYRNVQVNYLLSQIYSQMGIANVTYDTMAMNTYNGLYREYYFDTPPNDASVTTNSDFGVMCSDGTDIYFSVDGNKVYKRVLASGQYTYVTTIPIGTSKPTIQKLWYNGRNGHLWILYDGSVADGTVHNRLRRLIISSSTLSAEAVLETGVSGAINRQSVELVDINYTGSSYKYGVVFSNASGSVQKVRFVDGSSLALSDTAATAATAVNTLLFQKTGTTIWYHYSATGYAELAVNASGTWVDNGAKITTGTGLDTYSDGCFSSIDQRVFYADSTFRYIKSHDLAASPSTATNLDSGGTARVNSRMVFGGGVVWTSVQNKIYSSASTSASTLICTAAAASFGFGGLAFVYHIDRIYGLTATGHTVPNKFWQVYTQLPFIVGNADFTGMNVREALSKTLKAFNLVASISFAKKAFVYRRGSATGVPQTTGNTLALTIREATDMGETVSYSKAVQYVRILAETTTVSYDGTTFNAAVLSDKNQLEINNQFIPDQLAKDVCYYVYQFFKTDRNLYSVTCGALPLFQYEPFDNVTLTFSTTKIVKTVGGTNNPIYSITYRKDGSMTIEALI